MNEVKLKPCPFCGGKANLTEEVDTNIHGWRIDCEHDDRCYLRDVWYDEYDTVEDCMQAWNRRTAANPSEINANRSKTDEERRFDKLQAEIQKRLTDDLKRF